MAITNKTQYIEFPTNDSTWKTRIKCASSTDSVAWTTDMTFTLEVYRNVETSTSRQDNYYGSFQCFLGTGETYLGGTWVINVATVWVNGSTWTTVGAPHHFTLTHKEDGTMPEITVYGWFNSSPYGLEASITRDTGRFLFESIIKKASITSAPNFVDTDNPTVKYSNPMGTGVSALQMCIANSTGYTIYVPYRDVPKTGTSYTFQLTSTERQTLIDAVKSNTSIGIRFYIKMTATDGSEHRHSVDRTFSLTDALPDLAPAVVDMNETTKALTGDMNILVKYYSKAACGSNGTTKQGATIKSQKVVNGAVVKENTTGVFAIDNVESGKFEFSITDSRNNTTTAIVNKTLIEYVRLTCNQNVQMELVGETGATAAITISGNYFNNTFGAVNNTLDLGLRYGEDSSSMGEWMPIVSEFIKFNGNTYTIDVSIEDLQYDKSYVFQCRAIDKLATITTDEYATKLLPVFDWSENDFNFNVPVSFQGKTLDDYIGEALENYTDNSAADYIIEQGTASMGSNGTWYWNKWKNGKAECYGVRNFGNMAVSTTWGGLYRSESFNQNLPSGLFNTTPAVINIEYRGSNYGGWIAKHEATAASTTNSGGFIVVRPASATLSQAYIGFHVIGRWK